MKKQWDTLENRFWNAVFVKDGCWGWLGSKDDKGYGQIYGNGRLIRAHRLSWSMVNGEIPKGMYVCHHCDNPSCANPAHLFLGTCLDNVRDKIAKGRDKTGDHKGMKSSTAKLTDFQVEEILRTPYQGRGSYIKLAKFYGVGAGSISKIKTGKSWNHILPNLPRIPVFIKKSV